MDVLAPLLGAATLAAVHVFSQQLRILDGVPRSRFLSIAGGMALAFVVVQLLPTLAGGQRTLAGAAAGTPLGLLQDHIYLLVLASMVVFYGADRLALASRARRQDADVERPTSASG